MKNIQSPGFLRHPFCQLIRTITIFFHKCQNCKNCKPAIQACCHMIHHRFNCIIFAKEMYRIIYSHTNCSSSKYYPIPAQSINHHIVRKDKISDKKAKTINSKSVNGDYRCIQNLCCTICQNNHQCKHPDRHLCPLIPYPILLNSMHKQKQHRK